MKCLIDFVLDGDLCLEGDAKDLILEDPHKEFSLRLSNVNKKDDPHGVLSGQLIMDVPSVTEAKHPARDKIVEILNFLTLTTNQKFAFKYLKRVIDFTPGNFERKAIIFKEIPEKDVAEPALNEDFIKTAERLMAMKSGKPEEQVAMRWYRLGIGSENLEDQFSYFWFALEIVAENLKGTERVPSKCPHCQGPLFCESCKKHPEHRRYSSEAIQELVQRIHPENVDEVFETLQKIRHTLMHGRRISSIQETLPCTPEEAIEKLSKIVWHALHLMLDKPDPNPDDEMVFGDPVRVVRRTLVGEVHVLTFMNVDAKNPWASRLPSVQFDILRGPNKKAAD